jgi:hypothetical protein
MKKKIMINILIILMLTNICFALDSEYVTIKNTTSISDFIIRNNDMINTNIFLVDDYIDMDILFEDIEKDYQGISISQKLKNNAQISGDDKKFKTNTLIFKYEHDPRIFNNPVPRHGKGNGSTHVVANKDDPYIIKKLTSSMRGKWTLTAKASDATGKEAFDKYSSDRVVNFIVHERPTAKINMYELKEEWWLTGEESFDIDFQNRLPNKGIVKYEWAYETDDGKKYIIKDNKKKVAIPKKRNGKHVKTFILTVTDSYGATGSTAETSPISEKLLSNLDAELSKFNVRTGIPASEEIKVMKIETIPMAAERIEFSLYQNGVRKTPLVVLDNPADVISSEILLAKWRDIRHYQVPENLRDGDYIGKVRAIKGSKVLENTHHLKVFTPIDLKPEMPSLVRTMESYDILSTTNKYASVVTVKAFKGTSYEDIISLTGTSSGDYKNWNKNYTIPDVPDGVYTFEFTAVTPNGNKEVKELQVKVEGLQVSATLMPNPALAGDEIYFTVDTKGFVDRIEIDVDQDIIAKDNRIGKYSYPTLRFNVDGSTYQKQNILNYILCVKTDQTLTKDNVRIRPEYTFKVRGYRGGNYKEVKLKLDVRRSVLDLLHPGVKTN